MMEEIVIEESDVGDGSLYASQAVLDEAGMDSFKSYILTELDNESAAESRKVLLEKVRKWRRQRIARPETEVKDEPFPKSTNLAPPLTMSKVNTIFGKTLAGFSLKRPFWDVTTNNKRLGREAAAFARLLNAYANDPFSLNLKPTLRKMLYEAVSCGFQFYELVWANERVSITNPDGSLSEAVLRSGPDIRLYRVEDFLTNQTWVDFQRAPWLALRFEMTWGEVLAQREVGRYDPEAVEAMRPFKKAAVDEAVKEGQELMGVDAEPAQSADINATYDLWKVYVKWIVDDRVIDLVGVVHRESGAFLYLETNELGWRLVGKIGYFEMPESIYDIGVCHQTEYLQEEAEMLHNLSGDAMKWTMLGMFKALKDSGIKAGERIYPGKIWMLDNLKDVEEMRFQFDLSPTIIKENAVMRYADMATGANQAMAGQADQTLKSGGGAMAQQVLMESSSTILDAEFDTLDEYVSEMGKLLAILVVRNKDFIDLTQLVDDTDAAVLDAFFASYSAADVVTQFRFSVKTTDIQRSESTKKETLALFSQLYSGYVNEVLGLMGQKMQLEMAAGAPQGASLPASPTASLPGTASQLVAFIDRAVAGKTDLMRQITDYMHVGIDPDKYFVTTEVADDGIIETAGGGTSGFMGADTGIGADSGNGLPYDGVKSAGVPADIAVGEGAQGF
jgi:hypothetical protein